MPELLFTHRRMREKIFETRAMVAMILGIKEIQWPDKEFALFSVMNDMWVQSRKQNPTRNQVMVFTGAWLRFLERLISELPDSQYKTQLQFEFDKIARGYEKLLSRKEEKHERG